MERESKFLIGMDGRENFYHKTFYTLKFMDHMNLSVLKANKKLKFLLGKGILSLKKVVTILFLIPYKF